MLSKKIKIYQLLLVIFLFTGIENILAQHNIIINNNSNRTVAVRIDGQLQNNLEPGAYKSYYVNNKSTVNFSLSETDPEVVQAIQGAAYQGNNWKFDWTQYQMGSSYVEGPGTINLVPALHSDGTYNWVTLQVVPLQQQSSYASYDYEDDYDDDEDLVWYMVIGLVVGALIALLPL
ncbi:MAG: hypothetical protein GYA14_08970 [Ignavibacteria bacterium]|nr:hypothetical protein [Ignavibacteria bacterium]